MPIFFDPNKSSGTLDQIVDNLKDQATKTEKDVNDALDNLKNGNDRPGLLQELQYLTTKWSLVFNTASSLIKSMRDIMQNILQKI